MTLTERHVQALWYDARLRPSNLFTRRGSAVNVVSPGEWNAGPGPDFRHAVLELGPDRRRLVGDVEVHLCPNDWDFHGHGADGRYRNVIAHVTWLSGPDPASLPPGAVSIWLGRFAGAGFDPAALDLEAYPFARLPLTERPCERLLAHDPVRARRLLVLAGRHRLRMKARRLAGRLAAIPYRSCPGGRPASPGDDGRRTDSLARRRQLFYEEVMTALGYSKNAAAFRSVAMRVPLAALPGDPGVAAAAFLAAGSFEEFDRGSLRPWNQPERRLASAARLFTTTSAMSLADAADFSVRSCRTMLETLRGESCVGRGRAAAVLTNIVAPWAMAEGRLADAPDWLPPEDLSEPVRLMAWRLFGRDHNPAAFGAGNGLLIQGLLELYRTACAPNHPDCAACRLSDGERP